MTVEQLRAGAGNGRPALGETNRVSREGARAGDRDEPAAALQGLDARRGKMELKAAFVQLRAKGLPYLRIAERLGVAKSTLANWNAELEAEIASAKAMELEALQAEFFVLKEGRIRLLGEQLQRLRGELASRDLTEVPTERLLELLLRYQAALRVEFEEVRPLSDREQARLRSLSS